MKKTLNIITIKNYVMVHFVDCSWYKFKKCRLSFLIVYEICNEMIPETQVPIHVFYQIKN